MGIIVKFILKNIREKKFRTFLILISVALSAALFFASWAISGTIKQMFLERMKQYFGDADIVIHPNQKSPSRYFQALPAQQVQHRLRYLVGAVEESAKYNFGTETVNFEIKGFNLDELQTMNPIAFRDTRNLTPFLGNKIIISRIVARNYRLRIGQRINLELAGGRKRFLIVGIANPVGIFQDDGRTNTLVMPRETLAAFFQSRGRATIFFLKANQAADVQPLLRELSRIFKRYTVREPFSQAELDQELSSVTTPFFIMLLTVLAMSVFIIYTSFKVITRERLPIIGTFRSVGATRRITNLVLLAESLAYGTGGGVLGCGLGIGILYIMANLMKSPWMHGVETTIRFSGFQLGAAFLIAVLLSFVSSAFPIIKTARIPVKDLVLNSIDKQRRLKIWKLPLGLALLLIALFLPFIHLKAGAMFINMGCLVLIISAILLLIPFITAALVDAFAFLLQFVFGNEGILAVKNLRNNKSILNNISLLAIGISSLLMINVLSGSVAIEVLNVWHSARFDIWMGLGGASRRTEQAILAVSGVRSVYGMYGDYMIELPEYHNKIVWLVGANSHKYPDYWDIGITGNARRSLAALDSGRNILITTSLQEKFGLARGDNLTLQMRRGKRVYRVAGFFTTLMENGSFAIIPERYYKMDMKEQYYNSLFIKTSIPPEEVAKRLKKKFERVNPFVMTVQAMTDRNMTSNAQMFLILQGFSVLALIIGIFGVLNNLLINFLERRRSLAMIRSVGMSKRQMIKMIFVEALTGGLIGGIVGICGGMLLILIIPQVLKSVNLPDIKMHYSGILLLNSLCGGVIITILASVGPAVKSTRLNLIDALKYE